MSDRFSLRRRVDQLPPVDLAAVPLNAACLPEDFPALEAWMRHVFPWGQRVHGRRFPRGAEYRKHWEVVQAARTLAATGVLRPDAEVLGVGAGTEPTIFWLTNHVRRVFATDLYLAGAWEESANQRMLTEPGSAWEGDWNPRRLVVQHMDALDLRYEDESFDAVFSSSSIEHFGTHDDVARSIREAHRVLRPGGVLTVSTELRIAGPGPGLPDILMFDRDELQACVVDAAPWEPIDAFRSLTPDPAIAVEFSSAAGDVQAHVAEHGEIKWAELRWSQYPQIVLRHQDFEDERLWTSVHLALRKLR
ncbi:MAG TPA: class I SAM-dependent methyltransferase [Acidimicrobiales bacterium]|nr:class I SAM-dependent methyltransferase [Acidimicrobiales bacterium]